MSVQGELAAKVEYIETVIKQYLPKEEGYQKVIFEAMNYSMLGNGKRIRPMFMLETYRLFGGTKEHLVNPFMAAMEMIHTYSLVHDDLPAMDNDDYRRGRKTTHVVYGEAMGILAGDALLNYAFEVATKAFEDSDSPLLVARALQVLARKAGTFGMIGGQVVDVTSCNQDLTKDKLDFIYRLKTSALIEGSMMIGGILAGASETQVTLIEQVASDIGLAFQIQDDILDITSSVEVLGKPIHSDERNKKTTYVSLEGIQKAKEDVTRLSERARLNLLSLGLENDFLFELIDYLINREK